jgi:hypothetical protein
VLGKSASPGVMPLRSSFANTVKRLSVLALTIPCGTHINNPAIGCILQELKAIWWVAVGFDVLVTILTE